MAEAAAAKAATQARIAAAILYVAALLAIHLHDSVSVLSLYWPPMSLSVATWNINSVRLRLGNVKRYLRKRQPDVLCLQETKCPDELFPHAAFEALGYRHRLVQGMKSYNGVAILSKVPFTARQIHHRCGKEDCRHIEVALDVGHDPILLDNLYIPAGGDVADPEVNEKFAHKLEFYREMADWYAVRRARPGATAGLRRIAVGDLNVAPLENDVWSHKQLLKIVSHTPIEVELFGKMMAAMDWIDVPRRFVPQGDKLYSWWSYRNNDWRKSNRGRRLDHILASPALSCAIASHRIDINLRDWKLASDHVPVLATFEV
jgi:exodeoxyribonuclease-3